MQGKDRGKTNNGSAKDAKGREGRGRKKKIKIGVG